MNEVKFILKNGLIYIPVKIVHNNKTIILKNCIFDTGSAGTTFDTDIVEQIGLTFSNQSRIKKLATVGGYQHVFTRTIDVLEIGKTRLNDFEIEIGVLSSKFNIDGIIGTDLIRKFNWKLDFSNKLLIIEV